MGSQVDMAIDQFTNEVKALNMWNSTTIVELSEFGRTLTSNGIGTDHAWGGNAMLIGGAVRGGVIHGQYPSDITKHGPLMLSRGRIIPTTPWESLWHGVAEWMDVHPSMMAEVVPNMVNFAAPATNGLSNTTGALFSKQQLFV